MSQKKTKSRCHHTFNAIVTLCILTCFFNALSAQIIEDGDYLSAVKAHTRSKDGNPGDKYWQNSCDYKLYAGLDNNNVVNGHGILLYFNNSPDTLKTLRIKLYQNLHRSTTLRLTAVDSAYFTPGMYITQIVDSENDIDYLQRARSLTYIHEGTDLDISLSTPLLPHDTIVLKMAWYFMLNNSKTTAPREGIIDSTTAFVAYWFPRVAVYDDVMGWDESLQNESSEFYNDFSDFDIHISMPAGYTVFATGKLAGKLTGKGITQWHYVAKNVTDFAWSASKHYISDTLTTNLSDGSHTIITAYQSKKQYPRVAALAKQCLESFSTGLPGVTFPFNGITIFEGRSQMEYPMMVNESDEAVYTDMATVTAHEISHSYFPFMMGINETRYGWMDEGWATFFEYHFLHDQLQNEVAINACLNFYQRLVKQPDPIVTSIPLMAPSDQLAGGAYSVNCYTKGWLMYETLKNVLGDSLFKKTLVGYMQAWRGKHPIPFDFFNFFNTYSRTDLNWIFSAYGFHFGTFDVAIEQVKEKETEIEVFIKNQGGLPLSLTVELKRGSGKTDYIYIPAKAWQHSSETIAKFKLPKKIRPVSIHLNTGIYPDVFPSNNDYFFHPKGARVHRRRK